MGKTINFNEIKQNALKKRKNEKTMFDEIINEIREKRRNGYAYKIRDMESICKKILEKLELNNEEPVPIVKIAKKMGFQVYQQEMEKELSGFIAIDEKLRKNMGKEKIIMVNVNDEIGHQRFVIAHELAHYLFDFLPKQNNKPEEYFNTYFKDTHDSESEARANRFAAELLMPRNRFVDEVLSKQDSVNIVRELQDSFQVQDKAIIKRMHEV